MKTTKQQTAAIEAWNTMRDEATEEVLSEIADKAVKTRKRRLAAKKAWNTRRKNTP